jgi:hypothetical protein
MARFSFTGRSAVFSSVQPHKIVHYQLAPSRVGHLELYYGECRFLKGGCHLSL